jgi:FkbM family methyltransferase
MERISKHRRIVQSYAASSRSPTDLVQLLWSRYGNPRRSEVIVGSNKFGSVKIRPRTTDIVVVGEMLSGAYDAAIAAADPELNLIVDLGAHIGLASRMFAQRFPRAEIIAVEPHPDNARMLAYNLREQNAKICRSGVAATKRRVSLTEDRLDGCSIQDGGDIVTVTIPELIGSRAVGLMKIDIEGTEEELFADRPRWIGQVSVIVCECHHPYTASDMMIGLTAAGERPAIVELRHLPQFGYDLLTVQL